MATSPRPGPDRQRSNSLPIVEALGCSTPEARLMIAEGRAAVYSRRHNRRNRSVHDERITAFNPRDHMKYLASFASEETQNQASPPELARSRHSRIPSNNTDYSVETVVPISSDDDLPNTSPPASLLGDYSANLALFIKAQLNSIPTYQPTLEALSPVSARSCPDFPFQRRSHQQSPTTDMRRLMDAPKMIEIPAIRPPMQSAFSAWSSTDDEADDEEFPLPDAEPFTIAGTSSTPSGMDHYRISNNRSFLFSSTPMLELDSPCMAQEFGFPDLSIRRDSSTERHSSPQEVEDDNDDDGYLSSHSSHPQLTSSSAPSFTSSVSNMSYFDYKQRPMSIASHMKARVIAALTPPPHKGKVLTAISPFEGAALANVHDVFIESQQRVHVDGMSFDMLRDFTFPGRVATPC